MIQEKRSKRQRNNKCRSKLKKSNKISKIIIKYQMKIKNNLIKMKNIVNFLAMILRIKIQNFLI